MKAPTMVCFLVAVTAAVMVFMGQIPGATTVTCNYRELAPCADAIYSSQPPSSACCNKIKEQRPCICGYLKDPSLRKLVSPGTAKRIANQCKIGVPNC